MPQAVWATHELATKGLLPSRCSLFEYHTIPNKCRLVPCFDFLIQYLVVTSCEFTCSRIFQNTVHKLKLFSTPHVTVNILNIAYNWPFKTSVVQGGLVTWSGYRVSIW